MTTLQTTKGQAGKQEVRCLFLKLLRMIQRFIESEVKWYGDFQSLNICYSESSGLWKLVDLEGIEVPDEQVYQAVNADSKTFEQGHGPTIRRAVRRILPLPQTISHHADSYVAI